jgi:hypothetical protein
LSRAEGRVPPGRPAHRRPATWSRADEPPRLRASAPDLRTGRFDPATTKAAIPKCGAQLLQVPLETTPFVCLLFSATELLYPFKRFPSSHEPPSLGHSTMDWRLLAAQPSRKPVPRVLFVGHEEAREGRKARAGTAALLTSGRGRGHGHGNMRFLTEEGDENSDCVLLFAEQS